MHMHFFSSIRSHTELLSPTAMSETVCAHNRNSSTPFAPNLIAILLIVRRSSPIPYTKVRMFHASSCPTHDLCLDVVRSELVPDCLPLRTQHRQKSLKRTRREHFVLTSWHIFLSLAFKYSLSRSHLTIPIR